MRRKRRIADLLLLSFLVTGLVLVTSTPATPAVAKLPLGPTNLVESRSVKTLAPGLTLTTITRGHTDPSHEYWTIGINLPVGAVPADPDPDADQGSLATRAKARSVAAQVRAVPSVAAQLKKRGWKLRVEPVDWAPRLTGYPGGLIGYTLRVGRFTKAPTSADPLFAALVAADFKVFAVYTGQDGRPGNTGPWVIRMLTVDPKKFTGRVDATVGKAVSGSETTSAMAAGALAAVNGGFFTLNAADGSVGVPAGLSVVRGVIETAAVNSRVALILGDRGRTSRITALSSRYTVRVGTGSHRVDGLNRPPGLIRNCGGVGGDRPTQRPVQDFTCKDSTETVALTAAYRARPPAGSGVEVLVDPDGVITKVRTRTGKAVPTGYTVVQATGTDATWLSAHARVGVKVRLSLNIEDSAGKAVKLTRTDSVVNGGPRLLRAGQVDVDIKAAGMVHEDPALHLPASGLGAAWGYNWFVRDHPRTAAGTDAKGRLLLVQVDGRQAKLSQGLSIAALAAVMRSLGAVEAINLDGGGSSATVVKGTLVSSPSDVDADGHPVERRAGDAITVRAAS